MAQTDVQALIDSAKSNADSAFTQLQSVVSDLASAGGGAVHPGGIQLPAAVKAPDFVPYISPDLDLYNAFGQNYDTLFNSLSAWLKALRDSWLTEFFPKFDQLLSITDAWLNDVITNGTTGIPVTVQNAIWERGRERVIKDAVRTKQNAISTFAAMGHSIPGGPLAALIATTDQAAQDKISELNRDITIKTLDVQIDMIKFAIKTAVDLRVAVTGAMNDYLRTFMMIPQTAGDIAYHRIEAARFLWAASVEYYKALVSMKNIEAEINIATSNTWVKQGELDVLTLSKNLERQLIASETAAKVYGSLASAAMSSINGIITNAYQETLSQ